MQCQPCASCARQLAGRSRRQKSTKRKVEVIPLRDTQEQGLRAFRPAAVSPGAARNNLVPNQLAVYAHHLNRMRYADNIAAAESAGEGDVQEDEAALRERVRNARMFKKLRSLKLEVDVVSDNNAFLQPYGVPQVVREILKLSNIVIAPELVMLPQPYRSPGTYQVPLAVLDEAGEQVSVSLQLVPRQASAEQLKTDTAS